MRFIGLWAIYSELCESASPAPSDLFVSPEESGYSEDQSSLVHGCHLHSLQTWVFISGGDYELAEPESLLLAFVQYAGDAF